MAVKGFGKANIGLTSAKHAVRSDLAEPLRELTQMMAAADEVTATRRLSETRVLELHPSSFPFCPIIHTVATLENGLVYEREEGVVGGGFYTSIGTAVHETYQHAMSLAQRTKTGAPWKSADLRKLKRAIVGDYVCKKCGHVHAFSAHPATCDKCRHKEFTYEEILIKYGKYIVGHTDGLMYLDGKYYIIDYKTTSSFKIGKHQKEGNVFPAKTNVPQIKSYVVLVEMQYHIKIEGWFLIYIARDNYNRRVIVGDLMDEFEKEGLRSLMADYEEGWRLFMRVLKVTSKARLLKLFDKIDALRPCKCKADHDRLIQNDYFTCPLAETGACFKPKLLRKVVLNAAATGNLIKLKEV